MHTPSAPADTRTSPARRGVHPTDRVWDFAAFVFVAGGVGLFAFGRRALLSLGAGTYAVPKGLSAVAVTDMHVAQTRMAVWLVGFGVVVGVVSALRHKLRGR